VTDPRFASTPDRVDWRFPPDERKMIPARRSVGDACVSAAQRAAQLRTSNQTAQPLTVSARSEVSMVTRLALFLTLLLTAPIAGCGRPFVLFPGGALEGQTSTTPASWSFTDDVKTVQLETRPADPYSVNIWVIAMGSNLYVHAGANRSTWVENMEADPNVRLRVNDSIYELAGSRVEDQEEFDRFSAAYEQKYARRPRNENVAEAYLFRLGPR
jgi:hypothetical protein